MLTMIMNRMSRPQNFMNVNAYAANAAIRIGMKVAGSEIARLLMKPSPMFLPWSASL